ncbi:GIY-YIG nuclease family protein [Neolewinella agarilytica]|uniref:Putative endonuclease n=1 Tax=Neolewinella agarilytica TaxID=478744 RepID=A0A1H9C8F6_9BACT|nr:putative endonuclease [Neolewinella agarilytica]
MLMYYIYLLYSSVADRYYVGYTSDLEQRVQEHNSPTGARWTRGKGPWQLSYFETFKNERDARKREIEIKKKKRRSYLEWLIENGTGTKVS